MKFSTRNTLKFIKQFSFNSIFFKYLKKFTLIILIPFFLITGSIYITYRNISNSKIEDTLRQSASYAYSCFNQFFENSDHSFTELYQSSTVRDFFVSNKLTGYGNSLMNELRNTNYSSDDIESVTLYNFSYDYIFCTAGGGKPDYFREKEWYKFFNSTLNTNFIVTDSIYDGVKKSNRNILSCCYGVYINSSCRGLIIIDYKFSSLDKKLESNENIFYLINNNDKVIYSTDKNYLGKKLNDYYSLENNPNNINESTVQKDGSIMNISVKFDSSPFKLAVITDTAANTRQIFYQKLILVSAIFLAFLLPVLISLYISVSSYKTLSEIITVFTNLDVPENIKTHTDEIGFILDNILATLKHNKSIESELTDKMAQLKNAQLSALQLQFNHHFLFNTLNFILLSARADAGGKNSNTAEAIIKLSSLLRISLDTSQYIVPVFSEIMYCKKYIEIEMLRQNNNLEIIWDVDESLYEYKIIKFLFQPIIENAFRYGIYPSNSPKKNILKITGKSVENNMEFHIMDNGKGIEKEKLISINNSLNSEKNLISNHIGLANVNERIKLIFGPEYGLSLQSDENGTDVKIVIPKK